MSPTKQNQFSLYALIGNLIISGATLSYVRETEHRITLLESRVQNMLCEQNAKLCKS